MVRAKRGGAALSAEHPAAITEALRDLMEAVDSVCNSDAFSDEGTLEPHARSVLELSLQRAREAVDAVK